MFTLMMPFARLARAIMIITLRYQSKRIIKGDKASISVVDLPDTRNRVKQVEVKVGTTGDPKSNYGHGNNHKEVHIILVL